MLSNKNKIQYNTICEFIFWGGIAFLVFFIGSIFAICILLSIGDEQRKHYSYSEETIDQLQGNLPTYFRKIREQLRAYNLSDDLIRIDEDDFAEIVCNIEFKDSNIHTYAALFQNGEEEAHIWYTKEYRQFKQLTDLKPPEQKELEIMCSFAESLMGKGEDAVHSEILALFLQEIFNEDEMSKLQTQLDNGGDIGVERREYFKEDGISWYVQLESGRLGKIIVNIRCNIHLENGDASEQE